MKTQYFQGESIIFSTPRIENDNAAWAELGGEKHTMVAVDDEWRVIIDSSSLKGVLAYRVFVELADCKICRHAGNLFVAPAVSTHRQRAEAIQRALDAWASTPYGSITIGSITVSDKNVNDLRSELSAELAAAEREEQGLPAVGGRVRTMRWRFD